METGIGPAGVTLGFGITARLVRDRRAGLRAPDTLRTPAPPAAAPFSVRRRVYQADDGRTRRARNSTAANTRPRPSARGASPAIGTGASAQEAHPVTAGKYRNTQ